MLRERRDKKSRRKNDADPLLRVRLDKKVEGRMMLARC